MSGLNEPDPVAGNDSASVAVTVLPAGSVDLSVDLAVDTATPAEEQQVEYAVTVTNNGPSDATGVVLTDALPLGLTYVGDDAGSSGTFYDSGSGVWTVGSVLNGQTRTLHIMASVAAGTGGSTLTNTASVSGLNEPDPVVGNDSASVAMTVLPAGSGAGFQQDGGAQGVVSMEAESYHASVVAPDGHAWLSAGSVYPGYSGSDALQVLPEDRVNYSTGYSSLSPQLDYQVNFVTTGTHYIWVRAWGPSTSSNSLHVGLDGQELATGENLTVPTAGGYVWVGKLASKARATLDVATTGGHTVNVWVRESGTVVDKVVLTTDAAYDPSTVNGGLGPDQSVQGDPTDADLSVGLMVDAATQVVEGQSVEYTVTVTNNGPLDATGVVLTATLPVGLTYAGDDAASTGTFYGGGVWAVGGVLNGQTRTLHIMASVAAGTGGSTLTYTASVSGLNEPDPVAGNDSASVAVTVLPAGSVDLSVDLAVDTATPAEEQQVEYAVTVTNNGPSDATGVVLTDALPLGLTYVGDDAGSSGTFYDSGSGVWTVGSVLNGQTRTLHIMASVAAGTGGSTLTNTASVSGLNEPDPVVGNDSASVAMTVLPAGSGAGFQQDGGAQGVVSMEAESYHASVVAPDGHAWLSAGAGYPGYSGSDALQALPEDRTNHSINYSTLSPQLDYQVNFVTTGTHYIWVRAWGPSTSSNSLHVGLDGQELATGENLTVPTAGGYVWVGKLASKARATLDVATTGGHTVNVWVRESGTVVDKVVLTTDAAYDPSTVNGGLGPDESGRETGSTVEKPTITPNGGIFSSSVLVTLASNTPGATIYYTLDGSDPTASTNEYTGPFLLTVSATLKARAILAGFNDSAIETAFFQFKSLPSGLDLYFPFNETSGSAFTDTVAGVTAGCVSCPTPVSGRVSGAQQYDGIGNAVDVPDVGLFDWATTDRFSLEAWVNKSAACIGSESIVGRHETGSQLHWWLGCENGIAAFTLTDSGGTGATILGTTDIADGQWHHLVAVRDAISGEIRLYVDGVEEAAAAVAYTADFAGAAELNIGWLNDTATDYHFAGTIDELALHSRVLTPAEISRHYKDGTVGLRRGVWGCESPVAIMPLGDSITNMQGYRPQLYFDLVDAGYNVDFVGTRTDSTGTHDRNHEGHGGITISGVAASLNTWLTQNPPDAVLLHIGTNEDPSFPYPSAAGVEDLHTIIDAFDPNISIVQARIINKVPNEPLVTQFNDNVVAMAAARVANGENITIADHESALNYIDDMNNDGIHPLQVGFDKMVPVWFEQLAAFLPACNQTLPQTTSQAITTAEVGVPYAYQLETRGYPSPEFSLLTAPAGMTIHPDTGNIDWVPTIIGSYNISVQVQNLAGTTTHDFTITVN